MVLNCDVGIHRTGRASSRAAALEGEVVGKPDRVGVVLQGAHARPATHHRRRATGRGRGPPAMNTRPASRTPFEDREPDDPAIICLTPGSLSPSSPSIRVTPSGSSRSASRAEEPRGAIPTSRIGSVRPGATSWKAPSGAEPATVVIEAARGRGAHPEAFGRAVRHRRARDGPASGRGRGRPRHRYRDNRNARSSPAARHHAGRGPRRPWVRGGLAPGGARPTAPLPPAPRAVSISPVFPRVGRGRGR